MEANKLSKREKFCIKNGVPDTGNQELDDIIGISITYHLMIGEVEKSMAPMDKIEDELLKMLNKKFAYDTRRR